MGEVLEGKQIACKFMGFKRYTETCILICSPEEEEKRPPPWDDPKVTMRYQVGGER